jgi:hypothetical protein
LETRIAAIEQVLDKYFRGPRLDEARGRSNREIEAFNARSKTVNAELAQARACMAAAVAPGRTTYVERQQMDNRWIPT